MKTCNCHKVAARWMRGFAILKRTKRCTGDVTTFPYDARAYCTFENAADREKKAVVGKFHRAERLIKLEKKYCIICNRQSSFRKHCITFVHFVHYVYKVAAWLRTLCDCQSVHASDYIFHNKTLMWISNINPLCYYTLLLFVSAWVRLGFQNTVGECSTKDCYMALFFP